MSEKNTNNQEQPEKNKDKKIPVINILKWLFVLIIVIIITMVIRKSGVNILNEIRDLSGLSIVLLVASSVIYNIYDGIGYYLIGQRYNPKFTVWDGIKTSYYSGFFRLATLGSATAISGVYYLSTKKVPPARSTSYISLNYMLQKIAVLMIFLVLFVVNYQQINQDFNKYIKYIFLGIVVTILIATGFLMICTWKPMHRFLFFIADKLLGKTRYKSKADKIKEQLTILREESLSILKDKKMITFMVLCNIFKFFFGWYLIPYVMTKTTGLHDFIYKMGVTSMASALAGVIPSPGSAGSLEALFYAMYQVITDDKALSMAVSLVYRGFTYFLPFIIGAFVVAGHRIKIKREEKNNRC